MTRATFRDPVTSAKAFLDAVKAKDINQIAMATALHAATESTVRNQKLFQAILAKDIAQEDLDEFAKKLEGFQVAGTNTPISTGSIKVVIQKTEKTSIFKRTLTMRHEKAGWKVQDISGQGEIQGFNMRRPGQTTNRRR